MAAGEAATEMACREAAGKPADAEFIGASSDGSKAFFLSTQQLTDAASEDSDASDDAAARSGLTLTVGANGCNLYEYDLGAPAGHELIDASAGDVSGEGPRVQGVLALSPDGSHVYFVAKGVLSTVAQRPGAERAGRREQPVSLRARRSVPGGPDGVHHRPTGVRRDEWNTEPGTPANVTPEGRFLVFVSHGDSDG